MQAAAGILSDCRRTKEVDLDTLARFARTSGQMMHENNACAQHTELSALHDQVTAWLGAMSEGAREQLYVVVCGSHQARYQHITMEYFQHLLGEDASTGAHLEDRLIYAESSFEEDQALDLIARHIIDQEAGKPFLATACGCSATF